MSTKNLQGECQQCGGQFEFPVEAAGVMGECPHCGQQTDCVLAAPPEEKSPVRTKAIGFSVVAALILVGGLIAALVALKRAERIVGRKQETQAGPPAQYTTKPTDVFAAQNFRISPVTLETTPGTKLIHAQGSITNLARRQRFGVKVELDLFDAAGKPVATTSDYVGVIEPNAEWKFSAPVVETKAASAKVTAIKETK